MNATRRQWLWMTAAGAGAWSMGPRAWAKTVDRPWPTLRRFIGVFTPHGMAIEHWRPGPDLDLSAELCSLAPLEPFKDRMLVLEGLDLAAGIHTGTVGHDAARVILTGSGADARSPSLDQYLALDLGLGLETPHSSLTLAVGNDESAIGWNLSYGRDGTPLPKRLDPSQTFAELFGGPLIGASPQELAAARARGKSALDVLRGDLGRLQTEAPASERAKLQRHHDALRELEKRLAGLETACTPPKAPPAIPKLLGFGGGEPFFEKITNLHIDLLARAMHCDLTRIATLFLNDLSRTGRFDDLPVDVHTDVAHLYDACTDDRPGTPSTWVPLAKQNRYTYGQVATLLERLRDEDVLDDTIIVTSSDMGDPARHSSRDVPTLVFSPPRGPFKTGRHLRVKELEPTTQRGLVPNNRLLVSLCQAFGDTRDRFGVSSDPEVAVGTLPCLTSTPGKA